MQDVPNRPQMRARAARMERWRAGGLLADRTLAEELRLGAAAHAGALIAIDGAIDGADFESDAASLYAESRRVAASLADMGFEAGDVIAIQLPNCRENLLTFLAALQLGMVVVPIVMIYGPAELGFILGQCGARALVVPGRWRNVDVAARLRALPPLPRLERIFVAGPGGVPGPAIPWAALQRASPGTVPDRVGSAQDVCLVNYTSGTTAAPKGVMHTHETLAAETRLYTGIVDLPGGSGTYLGVTPAGHIGAAILILRPYLSGTGVIFANAWDAGRVPALIRRHGVAQIGGVPLVLNALLDLPELPPTLRAGITGGAGVPPALVERADARGLCVVRSYGSTEHPTVSGGRFGDALPQRAHSDGRLGAGVEVRLVDDDGNEVPPGQPGEIVSIGPELFVGYFDASLDAAAFTDDGWYRSGDIGVLDADGLLAIVDRKKDIIIRGGENVSSQDVEAVMARHPAVAEAAAVAWPDTVYGERVGVFVRLRPGQSIDIPAIQAHFAEQGVAKPKTPERLVIVEDFERTAMGKVVKATLRRRVAELVAREITGA